MDYDRYLVNRGLDTYNEPIPLLRIFVYILGGYFGNPSMCTPWKINSTDY